MGSLFSHVLPVKYGEDVFLLCKRSKAQTLKFNGTGYFRLRYAFSLDIRYTRIFLQQNYLALSIYCRFNNLIIT